MNKSLVLINDDIDLSDRIVMFQTKCVLVNLANILGGSELVNSCGKTSGNEVGSANGLLL
jgi:hypothetical protein